MTETSWVECPNHGGAFDCTPFCPVCEGEQEFQTGWRDCVECGGAFWDSDDARTICCDRKPTLDSAGRFVWATK